MRKNSARYNERLQAPKDDLLPPEVATPGAIKLASPPRQAVSAGRPAALKYLLAKFYFPKAQCRCRLSRVREIFSVRSFLLESHEKLYLDLAAEHRRKADASTEPRVAEGLLNLVRAYELAAESIRKYPEAA